MHTYFKWVKYSYLWPPMGISGSPDIFQEKMSDRMRTLDYIHMYHDDLLTITRGNFDDHLTNWKRSFNGYEKQGSV